MFFVFFHLGYFFIDSTRHIIADRVLIPSGHSDPGHYKERNEFVDGLQYIDRKKATASWMRIHTDFGSSFLGKMFLIIYDSYSKWIDSIPITNRTLSAVIDHLRWNTISYSLSMEYQIL